MRIRDFAVAVLAAASVTAAALPAAAGTIVDTGTPGTVTDWALDSGIAARFQVANATTITGIEGYFSGGGSPGTYTIALYSDGTNTPGTELFSTQSTVTANGWNGKSGLNWAVNSGFFWVGFEVRPGQTFTRGGMPSPAPSPLLDEAYNRGGRYFPNDGFDIGVRIYDGAVVPEPATWALMICGFGLAGAALRRRTIAAI